VRNGPRGEERPAQSGAGEKVAVPYRKSKRITRAGRDKEGKGLIHVNMGRPLSHRIH
jgi:hypothetical protein